MSIIVETAVGASGILRDAIEQIKAAEGDACEFFNATGRWVRFAPKSWLETVEPIGTGLKDKRAVVVYEIFADLAGEKRTHQILATIVVCPCSDLSRREKLVEQLIRSGGPFRIRREKASQQWTRIVSLIPYKWSAEQGPDQREATERTIIAFAELRKLAGTVEAALASSMPRESAS